MFISLKWKAVAFLSVVLISISSVWIGQNVYYLLGQYEEQSQKTHLKHQQILDQILTTNFVKLSQISQILAEKPEISQAPISGQELNQFLERQWLSLNINSGLDYLAIFSPDGELLGQSYAPELLKKPQALQRLLKVSLLSSQMTPQSLIYCEVSCTQLAIEPIVQESGQELYMVLGQNMADTILRFHRITNADLAVLLMDQTEHRDSERVLNSWNATLWAMSRYAEMFPLLSAYASSQPVQALHKNDLYAFEKRFFLLKPLTMQRFRQLGAETIFVDIRDESEQQTQLWKSIWNGVATGLLALLISEALLLFLLFGPLQRLTHVAAALNLLPEHRYQEVARLVIPKKRGIQDELSLLEQSTRQLSQELETLHEEVELKNLGLREQLDALSRSRAFLKRLFDNANLFIVTQNAYFQVLSMNAKYQAELGGNSKEFLSIFADKLTRQEFVSEIQLLFDSPPSEVYSQETELISVSGQPLVISWTHTLVEDEQGQTVVLSIGMDLTQRKQDQVALKWLANNDSLTKIGNRRAFKIDLDYMLDSCDTGAVVLIDINHFKQINDLYGHATGDKVLIAMSSIIKQNVRSNDSVSRLASDEFSIVFQEVSEKVLLSLLKKLSQAMNSSIIINGNQQVEFSACLGAALYPKHGNDVQSITAHADLALHQAKKKGLSQWHLFNPEDNNLELIEKDHELISLIRKALKPGAGLFRLVFQPIMHIQDQTITHYEVLLRLTDLDGNAVFPNEFIPAAERMGLIRAIDEWVLNHAFSRLESETKLRKQIRFSINISAPTLQSSDLPKMFSHYFEQYQFDADQVMVELTETAYIDNFNQVLANLETLHHAGFKVALDDFGVGFSSFSYLKKMPLSYVKLDGSYIHDLVHNRDNQIFVESLSNMVRAFGMQTIAEFVEDQQTLDRLKALGVTYGQGYHIGKPLPDLLDEGL